MLICVAHLWFGRTVSANVPVSTDLRVCCGDVLIQPLVMMDCVFQILEFRG